MRGSRARRSRGLEGNAKQLCGRPVMFEALGNHAEGKGLDSSHRFVACAPVAQDAGQVGHFGNPASIIFAFELDGVNQAHTRYSSTAKALPNTRPHPTRARAS